jgi:hypothetical protein
MRAIFYSDAHMRHLLKDGKPRYTNVQQNSFGDQIYGSSHASRETARVAYFKQFPVLYRIVVKPKERSHEDRD